MPGIELSAEDRAGMSPDEIEALTSTDAQAHLSLIGDTPAREPAAAAAEEKPAGEAEKPASAAAEDKPAAETPAAEGEAKKEGDGTTDTPTEEELAAVAVDGEPVPERFNVPTKDFAAERTKVEDKIDEVETKWSAGELTDEDRVKQLRTLRGEASALDREQSRAEALAEINDQTSSRNLVRAATDIAKAAKEAGTLDYAVDKKAVQQFDQQLQLIVGDPDNAKLTASQMATKAHAAVLAIRGIAAAPAPAPAPAAAAPAAPAPPAPRDVLPVTLTGLPNAGMTTVDNTILEQMSRLQGEDLEEFMARQPANVVSQIMRQADATAMGFASGQGPRRTQARSEAA